MTDVEKWLQEVRGLDVEVCSGLGLKQVTRRDGSPALAIPYRKNGEVYGHKLRAVGEKEFAFHPPKVTHHLWNVDILRDPALEAQPVIITEGELDAISCIEAGFVRAVSIPDGWTDGMVDGDGAKVRPILSEADALRRSPCVIVAGDADSTGASFIRAVANLLDGHPVRYCEWPEGCKDPNDVLRQHGAKELAQRINAAKMLDPTGGFITGFSDLPPVPSRRVYRLDYEPVDRAVCFEERAISVATGIPGHGKSTFVTWACHHAIRAEGVRVGMMAFETHPHRLRDHLARLNTGRPWDALNGAERAALDARLDRHWRVVHRTYDDGEAHTVAWLHKMVKTLAVRDQCKIIVVDPWNELEHLPEPGESLTVYTNFALMSIRQWAERYGCHICVVAHPRKFMEGKERPPVGYDIADSAAWSNKPSLGFSVFNDAGDPETGDGAHTQILTWKVRDTQLYGFGKGRIKLDFDSRAMVYRRRM